ncbi:MAG TPA: cytochrome c [Burkholderiaceae bacterium]|nr:cytochrome c [Burkholderiaceae bacterium]
MKTIRTLLSAVALAAMATGAHAGGNAERGKAAVEKYACASCHGADFNTPSDPAYPRLANQHPDYIEHALKGYKNPTNPAFGRQNAIMQGFAGQLSAQDIKDIAAYLSSLPGQLVTRK